MPAQAPPAPPPVDASYDWHALLIAPFGSVLKEIPLTLHEVLLFRDETHGSAAADDGECYAIDASPPRFIGRTPDEYLLCFKQDRLLRIQAAVGLTSAEAPEVFATACAGWLKNANPAAASTPNPAASNAAAPTARHCEGRDGAVRFSAHLEEDPAGAELPRAEPPRAEPPPAETTLSIVLDSAPAP